jgi:predicted dehydrogenase
VPQPSQPSRPLRHAVVGVGAGIFGKHRSGLALETAELVAATDLNPEAGARRAAELGCAFYLDLKTLLAEAHPDVVVILTPHPSHAEIAVSCLEAGAHVIVEKPLAVQVAEADAIIEAAAREDRHVAVTLQQRLRPEVQRARDLIESGVLSKVQHLEMAVNWFRPASYFALGAWRATWRGEGGGVLMNQAPHNLDLICYLLGLPERVVAWTRTTLHRTETEDTAQAMLEWAGGALGSVHISTAEAGRPERLEVLGTGGYLELEPGKLSWRPFARDLRASIAEDPDPYGVPAQGDEVVEHFAEVDGHEIIYRNLHHAILHGEPLLIGAADARLALELANAMTLSSHLKREVTLPLEPERYGALLEELKRGVRA